MSLIPDPEPTPTDEPKTDFRIGDTVRVTNQQLGAYLKVGKVAAVLLGQLDPPFDIHLKVDFPFGPMRLYPHEVELAVNTQDADPVSHPSHYTTHPSGIECIQITEHMGFNLGNALKYIWRCDLKRDAIEDLKKARWYIEREIAKREGTPTPRH